MTDQQKGLYRKNAWMESDEWDQQTRKNVDYTLDLISRLLRLANSENVRAMTTSVPNYYQYNTSKKFPAVRSVRPHKEIERISVAAGVPYLNLYEALYPLIKDSDQDAYYHKNDGHFNPRGYKIWSDAQIDFMKRRELDLLPEEFYNQ